MKKFSTLLLCAFLLIPFSAEAQKKKKKGDKEEPKPSKFEELTKGAEKIEGNFTFYKKDGKLLLALTEDDLNNEFLMTFEISQGIGSAFILGGAMANFSEKLMAFEKNDGKIQLVQLPDRYTAAAGTPEANAVDLTFGSSILESAKIEAEEDGVMLLDVYSWFVSDLSQISTYVQFAVSSRPGSPGRANFDKSRSYLKSVKAFPENSAIDVQLTFKNNDQSAPRTVPDSRFIPVSIHYNMVKLPEVPMKPRMADDRMGYFLTVKKDFSNDDGDSFFKRYINKWRLECANEPGADGLCDPVEPITYYIDHTVPEQYRQAMMDGINAFDRAFEAAGFRNGIEAEMLPEDADPEDIRYATMRWNVSDQSSYGAIGPSFVDLRTGEILDADILFEGNMLLGYKNNYVSSVTPYAAIEQMFTMSEEEEKALSLGYEMNAFADEFASQGSLLRTTLAARGELEAGAEVPDDYVYSFMKWVTMHELGHTLGLRHNFRSSADTPFDKLHDKSFTKENGIYSSVMEYPTINIAPDGQENGHYYNDGIGSSDVWVISYGYTPDDDKAAAIARESAQPGHAYGTDGDARGYGALDPSVSVFDLSADPMKWGKQRAAMINETFAKLPELHLADNTPYYEVTNEFLSLANQYGRAVSTGIKYLGGQYNYKDHYGDPNGRMPFVNVPRAQQLEALEFIVDAAFAADAFNLPAEVYQQFGANRWSHWGNSSTINGRVDLPLHEILSGLQASLLNQITAPARLSRMRDAEVKFGTSEVVTIPELFNALTEATWSEAWNSPGANVPSLRRDLQRTYIDRMAALVTDAPNRVPADARSVARHVLTDLHSRLERRMSPPYNFDTYTEAHYNESIARIEAALNAGLELEN